MCLPNQVDGLPQLRPGFSGVTELEEIAGADARFSQALPRGDYGFQIQPLIHCVEYRLRSRFDAHPYLGASCIFEIKYCLVRHQVGAGLNLERKQSISGYYFFRELANPMLVQCEDIIAKPDV